MAVFLDTNILLYSISTAEDELAKRQIALDLLDRTDCVLSVQVLQEFYVQATRVSRAEALTHGAATSLIEGWLRFPVQENTLAVFQRALELRKPTGFAFWDCLIIAAAEAADCREVYTEDLAHGRRIGGLHLIDPFRHL
jgi:predicted nucleic acid-binding protein